MASFEIKKEDLINKIVNDDFKKMVIIGKNGVGKTYFLDTIKQELETKKIRTYFLKADINFDKEVKNLKDNNLQNISILLNELTNFSYEISEEKIRHFLEDDNELNDFITNSNSSLELVNSWIKNNVVDNKIVFDTNDEDLKPILVTIPKISTNNYEINFNKKISMGSFFKELVGESGTGQKFYTLLILINKVLDFYSTSTEKSFYLIIDEPEKLCHPELIVKIASQLKKISNKNIKVICASHSNIFVDSFIDDFDQLILMENSPISKNEKVFLQYSNELFLNESEYIFDKINDINKQFKNTKTDYIKKRIEQLKHLSEVYKKGLAWFHNWPIRYDFINSLFYKNIVLVEGNNDEWMVKLLSLKNSLFILKSYGKFETLFLKLIFFLYKKKIYIIYDTDLKKQKDNLKQKEKEHIEEFNSLEKNINILVEKEFINQKIYSFDPDLESKLGIPSDYKTYLSRIYLQEQEYQLKTDVLLKNLKDDLDFFFRNN